MDSECERPAADSKAGVSIEDASNKKHKSSSGEELSKGFMSQVLSILHMVA
jgi:hypothetical protein